MKRNIFYYLIFLIIMNAGYRLLSLEGTKEIIIFSLLIVISCGVQAHYIKGKK